MKTFLFILAAMVPVAAVLTACGDDDDDDSSDDDGADDDTACDPDAVIEDEYCAIHTFDCENYLSTGSTTFETEYIPMTECTADCVDLTYGGPLEC